MYFVEVMRPSTIAGADAGSGLVGSSPAFQRMVGCVERVAPTEANVLLLGESGTGKEMVAYAIHKRSGRAGGAFVPVECTGLPDALFESELFGYVKGAFTGASADKPGLVEAADGGTLFLDEIGDIPLSDQVKLLRLLETRQFRRVGSTESRIADFRLICATNRDLAELVKLGEFRQDLYFRLAVFEIDLPSLRERQDDLRILVDSMLQRLGSSLQVSDDAMDCLGHYPFPGNVRELRNIIERAVIMCDGNTILSNHLPERVRVDSPSGPTEGRIRRLHDVEADYLRFALRQHSGDRRSLARKLGISERALYRKISALKASSGASG
jgi:transcriptional regulator with PAS, ATPase and Fis domain